VKSYDSKDFPIKGEQVIAANKPDLWTATIATQKSDKIGNGSLHLPMWLGKQYTVWGGPYISRPAGYLGVCLLEWGEHSASVRLPIPDFSVPKQEDAQIAVQNAVKLIVKGNRVYAGCMAGQGRTGLFLALLAKSFGVADPIPYVRKNYYPHAVERKVQEDFITAFVPNQKTRELIFWANFWTALSLRKNLTNLPV
jgi:hypothetical protein